MKLILAIIGALFVLYWLISFVIGNAMNKEKLGVFWVKKKLKSSGIDPNSIPAEMLTAISKGAYLFSVGTGPNYGKYDANTFQQELDQRTDLLLRHIAGLPIHKEQKILIGLEPEDTRL